MQRFKKNKVKTVSEKVTELITKASGLHSSDESEDETAPKVADFDDEEYALPDGRSTDIRKRNVKLLSEQSARYRGKITSRKDLEMENNSEQEMEEESEDESDDDEEEDDDDVEEEEEAAFKAFGQKLRNGFGAGKQGANDDEDSSNQEDDDEQDSEEEDDDDDDEEALRAFGKDVQVGVIIF